MPAAWFLTPYNRASASGRVYRYPAINDFTSQIRAEGGSWAETEVLGDQALVKVTASTALLDQIAGTAGYFAVPRRWARLADSFSSMTAGERNIIQNRLLQMGYTQAEIDSAMGTSLGQWRAKTLNTLLSLMATRRLQPRYNAARDQILVDGPPQPTRSVADVDASVVA